MAGHITARCTNPVCNKTKSVPANYVGRTVRCPQCGVAFRIEETASVVGAVEAPRNGAEAAADWWVSPAETTSVTPAPPVELTPAAPDPLPPEPTVVRSWKRPRVAISLAVGAAAAIVGSIMFLLPSRHGSVPAKPSDEIAEPKRDDPDPSDKRLPPPKDSATTPRPLPGQVLRETCLALIEKGDEARDHKAYDDALRAYSAAEYLLPSDDKLGDDLHARILLVEADRDAHEQAVAATREQVAARLKTYRHSLEEGHTALTNKQYPDARRFFQTAREMEKGLVEAGALKPRECLAAQHLLTLDARETYERLLTKGTFAFANNQYPEAMQAACQALHLRLRDSKDALALLKRAAEAIVTAMSAPKKYSQFKRLDEMAQTVLRWDAADELALKWKKQAEEVLSVDHTKAKQFLADAENLAAKGFYEDAVPLLGQRAKLLDNDPDAVTLLQEMTDKAAAQDKKYQAVLSEARTLRSQAEALVTQAQAKGTAKALAKQNYTKAAALFTLAQEKYVDAVPLAPSKQKHDAQAKEGVSLCQKNANLCKALGM